MKTTSPLLIKPKTGSNIYQRITPKTANWNYLYFEARGMKINELWTFDTKENELVIVLLGGTFEERDDSKWLDYTFLFSNNILERNLRTCFVKANKSVNREPVSTDAIELKMYKTQKQTWIY